MAVSSRRLELCLHHVWPTPSWNKHTECNGSMSLSSCVCVRFCSGSVHAHSIVRTLPYAHHILSISGCILAVLLHEWRHFFRRMCKHTLPTLRRTASPQLRRQCIASSSFSPLSHLSALHNPRPSQSYYPPLPPGWERKSMPQGFHLFCSIKPSLTFFGSPVLVLFVLVFVAFP